jgi:hypothetical protein
MVVMSTMPPGGDAVFGGREQGTNPAATDCPDTERGHTFHTGPATAEMYDSDELPVLIRLPDLKSAPAVVTQCNAQGGLLAEDAAAVGPAAPNADPRLGGPEPPATRRGQRSAARSSERQLANSRRQRWLASLRQLAIAAGLAMSLLAVIVAFRDRGGSSSENAETADTPPFPVVAEFTQGPIGPASDVAWDQQQHAQAARATWPPTLPRDDDPPADARDRPDTGYRSADHRSWDPPASDLRPFVEAAANRLHRSGPSTNPAPTGGALSAWERERKNPPTSAARPPSGITPADYPTTDRPAPVSRPVAVPRFSPDQWRQESAEPRSREARWTEDDWPAAEHTPQGGFPTSRR